MQCVTLLMLSLFSFCYYSCILCPQSKFDHHFPLLLRGMIIVCVCFDHPNILRPYRLYLVFFCTTNIAKGVVRYVWCFLRQRLGIKFLGVKLRKVTIGFFISVRPSVVRMEQAGYHWTDVPKI